MWHSVTGRSVRRKAVLRFGVSVGAYMHGGGEWGGHLGSMARVGEGPLSERPGTVDIITPLPLETDWA